MDRLVDEGRLPNLAALRRAGQSVALEEELPGAAYTTLYTGLPLAEHGVHFPLQWSPAAQTAVPSDALMEKAMTRSVFRRLAAAGLRAVVLDPTECVPHEVEGSVLVSGVAFRARILLPRWARPHGAGRTLERLLGRPPRVDEVFGVADGETSLAIAGDLRLAPHRLASAAERLLEEVRPDLLWITFAAAHQAGHLLWGAPTAEGSPALHDVYAAVDEALGRVVARLPPGADILLMSPKGMAANASRIDLLPGMLERVLNGRSPGQSGTSAESPLWRLRAGLPQSFRARIAACLPEALVAALLGRLETLGRDWSRTRAFVPPCDVYGFVRFNLAGREAKGTVPDSSAAALAEEIALGLASFHDLGGTADGAPCVDLVAPPAGAAGRASWLLPDLLVHWNANPASGLLGVRSNRFGEVLRRGAGTGRTGNHRPGTWLTVLPGSERTRADARLAGSPATARLEDVAATICELLGGDREGLPGAPLAFRH
ncbi:MAG: alkaline phosphatase family protein [Acidobacteria bacterium]|nr:alkaline phosphatase family protein [Acidobacteriota bacterium]